jgi:hypothetical protein
VKITPRNGSSQPQPRTGWARGCVMRGCGRGAASRAGRESAAVRRPGRAGLPPGGDPGRAAGVLGGPAAVQPFRSVLPVAASTTVRLPSSLFNSTFVLSVTSCLVQKSASFFSLAQPATMTSLSVSFTRAP